jgi:hypothetical protein
MKTVTVVATGVLAALMFRGALAAGPIRKPTFARSFDESTDPMLPIPVVSVEVVNFPPVQSVAGTVSVDNLPLDDAGAVRVSTPPAGVPVLVQLDPVSIAPGDTFVSVTVNTAGYSRIGLSVVGVGPLPVTREWRWKDDDVFGPIADSGNGPNSDYCVNGSASTRTICKVSGDEFRVSITNEYSIPENASVKVYLIP